jgi:hypothetical protein
MPFPLPLPPEVIDIHDAALVAVQVHPVCVVTLTLPVDPLALTDTPVEETE